MPAAGDVIVSKKIPGIVMWGVFKKAPPLPPSLAYIYSWPAEKSQMDPVVELDREMPGRVDPHHAAARQLLTDARAAAFGAPGAEIADVARYVEKVVESRRELGHLVGERMLQWVVQLRSARRAVDAGETAALVNSPATMTSRRHRSSRAAGRRQPGSPGRDRVGELSSRSARDRWPAGRDGADMAAERSSRRPRSPCAGHAGARRRRHPSRNPVRAQDHAHLLHVAVVVDPGLVEADGNVDAALLG